MIEEDIQRLSLAVIEVAKGLVLVAEEFDKMNARLTKLESK